MRPATQWRCTWEDDLTTDADGRWRFDSVPDSMNDVSVVVDKAGFMPLNRSLTRSEFGIALDEKPKAKLALDRGLTVTGRITDQAGNALSGVLVRTQFLNEVRQDKTDDNGQYDLAGCPPQMTNIVVSRRLGNRHAKNDARGRYGAGRFRHAAGR